MQEAETEQAATGVDACCQEATDLLVLYGEARLRGGQVVVEIGPSLTALRYCPFCGKRAGAIARALASMN